MAAADQESQEEWLEFVVESDPLTNADEQAKDGEDTKASDRRQTAIAKLLSDSKDYLASLERINAVFIGPLTSLLPGPQVSSLFSNFSKIVESASKFVTSLTSKKSEKGAFHLVGDVCKTHATAVMGPYTVFGANKQTAISTLAEIAHAGTAATRLIAAEAAKGTDRDLAKLLNLPLLHLARLDSLYQRVLKATPAGHDDHETMKEAASRMHQTRESVHLEVKKLETLAALAAWEQKLVYGEKVEQFKLMQPGRFFVREGPLTLLLKKLSLMGKVKEPHDVKALVFTDLVLLVEPMPDNPAKLLVVVRPIILGEGTVHTVPNTDNEFLLTYKQEHHLLRCKDKDERESWMKLLLEPKLRGEGTLMQTRRDRTFTMGAQAPCMRGIAIREVAVPRPADGVTWGFELNPSAPSELKTLVPDGPAASAGLRDLDEIVTVNGVYIPKMDFEVISEVLKAASGPYLRLTVVASRRRLSVPRGIAGLGLSVLGRSPSYVNSLQIGGPAEAAGVKVGDQLLTVDGADVATLNSDEVTELLAKSPIVEIVVRTGMRALSIVGGGGQKAFTLIQPVPGQPAVVRSVNADSGAWLAGLRPGDQIWDCNGQPVRGEALEKIEALIARPGDLKLLVVATLRSVHVPAASEGDMSQALTAETPKLPGVTLTAGPPRVAAIATDGLSAISTGDLVWEINGTPVLDASGDLVAGLLARHTASLHLGVSLIA